MTHDELLARISLAMPKDNSNIYIEDAVAALRAAVELHKPFLKNDFYEVYEEEPIFICECDSYDEYDMGYPCETIQAIEKELK